MPTLLIPLVVYLLAFIAIWIGADLVVSSVEKLAQRLRLPRFTISFFILGLLTSLPEIAIGVASVANKTPEIFVGNLIGGVIVVFLLLIPLLGMANKGLKMPPQLNKRLLLFMLLTCFAPSLLTGDRQIDQWEALLCIGLYFLLFLFFSRDQGLLEKLTATFRRKHKGHGLLDLVKITMGMGLLVAASNQIVNSTLFFADIMRIEPFFVSLIVVSLGTNIPELSLVFRSLIKKDQGVAFADYLGSATANTLLFGILTLASPGLVVIPNHFLSRFLFIFVGLSLFYFFLRSHKRLSRREGLVLLLIYFVFVIYELGLQ